MLKSNGGYKIIDLKSPNLYNDIESCIDKPLLITNIEIEGIEKNPIFANVLVDSGSYTFNAYDKKFIINSDNEVSIENTELYYNTIEIFNNDKSIYLVLNAIYNNNTIDTTKLRTLTPLSCNGVYNDNVVYKISNNIDGFNIIYGKGLFTVIALTTGMTLRVINSVKIK